MKTVIHRLKIHSIGHHSSIGGYSPYSIINCTIGGAWMTALHCNQPKKFLEKYIGKIVVGRVSFKSYSNIKTVHSGLQTIEGITFGKSVDILRFRKDTGI